jgi:ataxia telangiectasia mutated family protein
VEDPDGFYGIQTHDVFDHLHRRVQHEGDHWRSFGLHGALLESGSGPSETSSTSLLAMRDLHKLGFNQVANSIFASIKSTDDKTDGAAASSTDPLLFELAWRTSDWDLPLPSRGSSDTLLYTALRAVHRERDLSVAVGIVNGAISIELEVLRDCGTERTGMIKKSVNNLICLNEVKKWIAGGQLPASVSTIESMGEIENGWGRVAHLDEAFA